jgi:hypothetical protein
MDLCREPFVILEIRNGNLRCLGHTERIPGEIDVRKVFKLSQKEKISL